jgi:hypothetical protein
MLIGEGVIRVWSARSQQRGFWVPHGETHTYSDQMPGQNVYGGQTWLDYAGYTQVGGGWTDLNWDGAAVPDPSSTTNTQYNGYPWYGNAEVWDPHHHLDIWDTCPA